MSISNTYGHGRRHITFGEAFLQIVSSGAESGTMNRPPCEATGLESGILILIMSRRVGDMLGPILLPIAGRQYWANQTPGEGHLQLDQDGTVQQVFQWLDETPTKCAHGLIRISCEAGPPSKAYLFGFVGNELCAEIDAALQAIGVQVAPGPRR